jgi:hypothetical protein
MFILRDLFNLALVAILSWASVATWREFVPVCPQCGSRGHPIPIRYGYPEGETLAKARAGEVHLGGCNVSGGNDPRWYCTTCREKWGTLGEAVVRLLVFCLVASMVLSRPLEEAVNRLRWRLRGVRQDPNK